VIWSISICCNPTIGVGSRSTDTVAREMGHGGEAMVRKVYGHLGEVRHRAEAVEYRVAQHVAKLGARLEALRGVGFARHHWHRPLDQRGKSLLYSHATVAQW
jgi:hypothetical protein